MNFGETSPLRSVIAYYPSCRDPQPWHAMVPALSLMAPEDGTAPPALCQQVFAQLPPGTPSKLELIPRHATGSMLRNCHHLRDLETKSLGIMRRLQTPQRAILTNS